MGDSVDPARLADERAAWLGRLRAFWDERAPNWDARSEENATAADRPADLARTGVALGLAPGSTLLDAGCGSGQWALAFADLGCRVTGIDLSPAMVERARAHAVARGLDVTFRVGDLSQLADPDGAYDAVQARVALQFVPDLTAALRELRRVLRPGGRLFASVPGALSPIYRQSWRRFLQDTNLSWVLPWELEALLTELGWRVVDGWGEYGATCGGDDNPFEAERAAELPRALQQAAATSWAIIAE